MDCIRFKNVCKDYDGTSVIKDLNLEIKQGERIVMWDLLDAEKVQYLG